MDASMQAGQRAHWPGVVGFVLAWIVFGLAAASALDLLRLQAPWLKVLVHYALVAPCAVWVGLRLGRLGGWRLFATSVLLALAVPLFVGGVLGAIARPAGGDVSWFWLFLPPHTVPTLLHVAATALVPVAWWWVLVRLLPSRDGARS